MLNGIANAFQSAGTGEEDSLTGISFSTASVRTPVPGAPFRRCWRGWRLLEWRQAVPWPQPAWRPFAHVRLQPGHHTLITAQTSSRCFRQWFPCWVSLPRRGVGSAKITQYTRYLTIGLALLNAIAYLFYFKSYGVTFSQMVSPRHS